MLQVELFLTESMAKSDRILSFLHSLVGHSQFPFHSTSIGMQRKGLKTSLEEEERSGYAPTFELSTRTAIMITTVLLIAPLNFTTQLQVTKHSTMICQI